MSFFGEKVVLYTDQQKEASRRLKQLPIHVLISTAMKESPLGTASHELCLMYLSKWRETHDEAAEAHKLHLHMINERERYEKYIADLLAVIRQRNAELNSMNFAYGFLDRVCRSIIVPKTLMLCWKTT